MDELKECPFCNIIPEKSFDAGKESVLHQNNGCPLENRRFFLDKWNTRSTPDKELMMDEIKAFGFCQHCGSRLEGSGMICPNNCRLSPNPKPEMTEEGVRQVIIKKELMPRVCKDSGQAEWTVGESRKLAKAIYAKFQPPRAVVLPERMIPGLTNNLVAEEGIRMFNESLDLARAAIEQAGGRVC